PSSYHTSGFGILASDDNAANPTTDVTVRGTTVFAAQALQTNATGAGRATIAFSGGDARTYLPGLGYGGRVIQATGGGGINAANSLLYGPATTSSGSAVHCIGAFNSDFVTTRGADCT